MQLQVIVSQGTAPNSDMLLVTLASNLDSRHKLNKDHSVSMGQVEMRHHHYCRDRHPGVSETERMREV